MEEDVPIEHPWINSAIESAQKKVEGHNFDIRKNLLEYDDVMNQQRKTDLCAAPPDPRGALRPEPTEEDKKEGKIVAGAAPTLGHSTRVDEPDEGRAADAGAHGRGADRGAEPRQGRPPTAPPAPPPSRAAGAGSACASVIYRQFGAYPDIGGIVEDRTGTLDRLADEVGASMIQQRERLLDLCEEMLHDDPGRALPAQRARRGLGPRRAGRGASRSASASSPTSRARASSARPLAEMLWAEIEKIIEAREAEFSLPLLLYLARHFYLEEIDARWIEHLKAMEALREGIGLRGYGQKDPKQEYKKEGFVVFGEMMGAIEKNVCEKLFHVQIQRERGGRRRRPGRPAHAAPRQTVESGGGAEAAGRQRRRRRRLRNDRRPARAPRPAQGRPQRSLPLRQRQEVQEVPRRAPRRSDARPRSNRRWARRSTGRCAGRAAGGCRRRRDGRLRGQRRPRLPDRPGHHAAATPPPLSTARHEPTASMSPPTARQSTSPACRRRPGSLAPRPSTACRSTVSPVTTPSTSPPTSPTGSCPSSTSAPTTDEQRFLMSWVWLSPNAARTTSSLARLGRQPPGW